MLNLALYMGRYRYSLYSDTGHKLKENIFFQVNQTFNIFFVLKQKQITVLLFCII
jgi:hypothetical protein